MADTIEIEPAQFQSRLQGIVIRPAFSRSFILQPAAYNSFGVGPSFLQDIQTEVSNSKKV